MSERKISKKTLRKAGKLMVDLYSKLLPAARKITKETLKDSPKGSEERHIAADGLWEMRRRLRTGEEYLEEK